MKPTERFSDRVENYVKYRPSYPEGVLGLFRDQMGLTPESVVADVGSGTGISARLFLENGNRVYGVEPNAAMRSAAEEYLASYPQFTSVNGTSEETGLAAGSVDFVICAQAFHWFRPVETRREFQRVLKPGGYCALVWNVRQLDSTEFLREYEKVLQKYATDYAMVRHERVDSHAIQEFFGGDYQEAEFSYKQEFDFDGLKGRLLSSSYMPQSGQAGFEEMMEELRGLFEQHQAGGQVDILYDTRVYFGRLG